MILSDLTTFSSNVENVEDELINEKELLEFVDVRELIKNPVVESAKFAFEKTDLVKLDDTGISNAAKYVSHKLTEETYTPSTWRTHALHLCPPETFSPSDPRTRQVLDWIFLISSLNFSFWSEKEGNENGVCERFGIEWRAGWDSEERRIWTGYWSLVAAIDRALEANIPITDPFFYSSIERCPDNLIASIFLPAPQCTEGIPLLRERIAVMRENGAILCEQFGGSFQGFLDEFARRHGGSGRGTALQLVQMITETFPSFRDEVVYNGRTVYFWKRAQILVAETWAAFYPLSSPHSQLQPQPHPFFPNGVHELTMFADYRVPQILHHLGILVYPPELIQQLQAKVNFPPGSREELSIRAASILAVEAVRDEIFRLRSTSDTTALGDGESKEVSSVLIDFYLWDLAKSIERGQDVIEGVTTQEILPAHRTRSIWY
ncbi:uncharacterized protein FOMMEDRAFT_143537 [Fomitiporia mediterranea MF3/22]|uniref:uncharacterized protein n=1 Tax=Fomitiporia mediterranea (strain MF3/22) TaxID=694068 RepID=UPI0004408BF5|nr:uncharacterized protein FOMMEDRAFT_143537 [Fomitiporia mediterranea MF3/22]EJC98075.1 hypothetical protein FOMMEDRAFT_143537 [Fomitiporia mediterranea MF3/22]